MEMTRFTCATCENPSYFSICPTVEFKEIAINMLNPRSNW